jgi:phosphatidylethanolamine/phosphatidyl-N-methylethanolamine N-methyltransferase
MMTDIQAPYDKLCTIYDLAFSAILNPGRREVISKINECPPSAILEIGVGTGLSLEKYKPEHCIVGIDISRRMIRKAERRRRRLGARNIRLLQMDAGNLTFADDSFDIVVALYVVSTTNNPHALIAEANRVCRRGGKIFILNHFSRPSTASVEKLLLPVTSRLGWKSYFERGQIMLPSLRLIDRKRTNLFGYWQMLEYECIR